jgi:hypothetical protein
MTEQYSSVRETVRKFNTLGELHSVVSVPIKLKTNTHSSSITSSMSQYGSSPHEIEEQNIIRTTTMNRHLPSRSTINDENEKSESMITYASPVLMSNELQIQSNDDDIGLEIIESVETRKQIINKDATRDSLQCTSSIIEDYEANDIPERQRELYPSTAPHRPPPPLPPTVFPFSHLQEESNYQPKRTLPLSNILIEIGALVVVFILCMVLVLAIRENQSKLRITMQVYSFLR